MRTGRLDERSSSLDSTCPPVSGGQVRSELELAPTFRKAERGQALIEMALVLPLILVFLLTLVDFGIAIDRREVLQHAVYEGSRKAIPGATVQEIKDRTVAQSQDLLTDADIDVCYIDSDLNGAINAGDDVRVSASYDYNFTIGGSEMLSVFGVTPPSIALTPKAESRLANGPQGTVDLCLP